MIIIRAYSYTADDSEKQTNKEWSVNLSTLEEILSCGLQSQRINR